MNSVKSRFEEGAAKSARSSTFRDQIKSYDKKIPNTDKVNAMRLVLSRFSDT